jgi:aspartyl protease family protein
MATGFMPAIIALVLFLVAGAAGAADVALIGLIGDKAVVLALEGGEPKTVKLGQTWNGITVLSVARDRATVEIDGRRRVLIHGPHYRAAENLSERAQTTLAVDESGHFRADGAVNGLAVRFIVDTGATAVALPARDANRIGLDYRSGAQGFAKTANGTVPVYRVNLDVVKLGSIELRSVDAVVIESDLETALLGMTFLNRVEMKRDGSTMTLIRRF